MSLTMLVPAAVPSVFQSSLPDASVVAANRHMTRPICNAGGVGVNSTQFQEASHSELAHKAYDGAGKSIRGLHTRMGRQVQRRAAISTLRVTAGPRPGIRDEEVVLPLRQRPAAHAFQGRRSAVLLYDQGYPCSPVCCSYSIFCMSITAFV